MILSTISSSCKFSIVHNFTCAKNYESWLAVDKVIAAINRLTFLAHPEAMGMHGNKNKVNSSNSLLMKGSSIYTTGWKTPAIGCFNVSSLMLVTVSENIIQYRTLSTSKCKTICWQFFGKTCMLVMYTWYYERRPARHKSRGRHISRSNTEMSYQSRLAMYYVR